MKILHATSHLEEIQGIACEFLSHRAGRKGAVVQVGFCPGDGLSCLSSVGRELPQPGRHRRPWVFILQMKFHERRGTQLQPGRIALGEGLTQDAVKQNLRLEIRAAQGELNLTNPVAQIQPLALLSRRAQQPLQPFAQVGCLADVRIALATQDEYGRSRGEFEEETLVQVGAEAELLRGHQGQF